MTRPNIYDRLHQKRQAAEALARQQAEQARLDAEAEAARVAPPPVLTLDMQRNALCIAGVMLHVPDSLTFQKVETTLLRGQSEVSFSACIEGVMKSLELDQASEQLAHRLHERHPGLSLIRREACMFAGQAAVSLDYTFAVGQERRHGRTVGALLLTSDGRGRQWLEISTLIDPDHSILADWLPEFDAMLGKVTAP